MSERDDIVTRLRTDDASDDLLISAASLLETDADEIERLRAQVARLTRMLYDPGTTHAEGCATWGPKHWQCALNERDALQAEVARLTDVLRRGGFVECDIPACNCGGWHHRYGLPERWAEITQALIDADVLGNSTGNKPLNAIKRLADERDALLARVEAAERRYQWLRDWMVDTRLLTFMRCQIDEPETFGDWWVFRPPYGIDGTAWLGYGNNEDATIDAAMEGGKC